jgi:hypothetical protein
MKGQNSKQEFTSDEKELMKRYLKARFEESRGGDTVWDSAMKKLISLLGDTQVAETPEVSDAKTKCDRTLATHKNNKKSVTSL